MIASVAVTIDAAGTLLHPREPVAEVYARHAARHGGSRGVAAIRGAFATAMRDHRSLRTGDPSWRRYWSEVIAVTTGCDSVELVDELLEVYARPDAWRIADDAIPCMQQLRRAGVRVGVLSNWDTRLRPLLAALGVIDEVDVLVVSGERGFEKPDARIFTYAADALGVTPAALIHIGDDEHDDIVGARSAGCQALHFGGLAGFAELASRLLR